MLIRLLILVLMVAASPGLAVYQVGDTVDDVTLVDLAGTPVNLSDHAGQIIVLNFFTTWCPGCNEEAELLEAMVWEAYRPYGVQVVAVDIDELTSLVSGWAAAQGVTYPIWQTDTYDLIQRFPLALSLPYNAVLDGALTLRYASVGFDLLDIRDTVEALLAEGGVPAESVSFGGVKALYR